MIDATGKYDEPLTAERLFAWHAALFPTARNGMKKITVGKWRTEASGLMQVVSGPIGSERVHFEAPSADRVADEISTFLEWFESPPSTVDPVFTAAVAHLWFVTIHPLDDGNGRITREEGLRLVNMYDGKYPYYGVKMFSDYSGMTKAEIDAIIDQFTNKLIFKTDDQGNVIKDIAGNLVMRYARE